MNMTPPRGLTKCWFSKYDDTPCDFRADGLPDRCHLIPKQRLKEAYRRRKLPEHVVIARARDPRVLVLGCRKHHHLFDFAKKIRLKEEDYPERLHDYAQEYGWFYNGPAEGWRAEHREE